MFKFNLSLIFLLSFHCQWTQASSREPLVQTLNEFRVHTQLHIQRVERLGMALVNLYFPAMEQDMAKQYLRSHDLVKIADWEKEDSVLRTLFSFYGKNPNSMTDREKRRRDEVVQDMIQFEDQFNKSFFQRWGHYSESEGFSPSARLLMQIEKFADLVDRGRDPVATEEFGRPMRSIMDFMPLDLVDKELVGFLEALYPLIVDRITYQKDRICSILLERPH